jgi:hypothetical protein
MWCAGLVLGRTESSCSVRLLARAQMPRRGQLISKGIPYCLVLVWTLLLSSEVLPVLAWILRAVLIRGLALLLSSGVALFARHRALPCAARR